MARLLNWLGGGSSSGLLAEVNSVVLQVPLSERGSIDLNNGVLSDSLGSDILTVGSVVHSVEDSRLMSDVLTWPNEVTSVQSKGSVLHVSTTASNKMDSLGTNLSVSSGTSELELSLLLMDVSATTSSSALMTAITRNTHNTTAENK